MWLLIRGVRADRRVVSPLVNLQRFSERWSAEQIVLLNFALRKLVILGASDEGEIVGDTNQLGIR